MTTKKTYQVFLFLTCMNCGDGSTRSVNEHIPLGMTIEEYLKTKECEHCRCKTIRRERGLIL